MRNVKIYGAGSIGNHLAYACRSKGWKVVLCDTDASALERTRELIYPQRYGNWDEEIELFLCEDAPKRDYDLIIVGTPPESHLDIAIDVIKNESCGVLLIEKPACPPSLNGADELFELSENTETIVCIGYNHVLAATTREAERILKQGSIGRPLLMEAGFKENWQGIFEAHPWLAGPQESYLGFWQKGGGATGEHSHAINIFQHFAHFVGAGRIVEVTAAMDVVKEEGVYYDRISNLSVRTERGLFGTITQDVVTLPTSKYLRVQGEKGFLEWHVNWDERGDAVLYGSEKRLLGEISVKKSRPDDFLWEVEHLEALMEGSVTETPISLQRGLETMLVVAAAYESHFQKKTMEITYSKGYNLHAIRAVS